MRTTEAARYARWSAMAALLIALVVAGIYGRRVWREAIAREHAPPSVPAEVHQQSAGFSFSKSEGELTIFTVRASHATEFKDQNKSLLENVWITIYGRENSRYDNLHAQQCNYDPASGHILCQGAVQIDLESAEEARQSDDQRVIHVSTKNIAFDRDSGEVTTGEPVDFRFPSGEGHGIGISYDTRKEHVRLNQNVELKLWQRTPSVPPIVFHGSSLVFGRDEHKMELSGPIRAEQAQRSLSAGNLVLEFDAQMHARRAIASGHAEVRSGDPREQSSVAADTMIAALNSTGAIEGIETEGNVRAHRKLAAGQDDFEAQHVVLSIDPVNGQPKEMDANGEVRIASLENGDSRRLQTSALAVRFAPAQGKAGRESNVARIESFETLAPGIIETKSAGESTRIRARKFSAEFNSAGRMEQLFGHSGIEIDRQLGDGPPQVSTAEELAAKFDANGDWSRIEESGHVQFRQGDRTAQAGRGVMDRASNRITLSSLPGHGAAAANRPSVADSVSRTTASLIEINQGSGDVQASGSVQTSYFPAAGSRASPAEAPDIGNGPAHISADKMAGNSSTGHALYTGRARLWQGDSVIQAASIELWRQGQKLEARENVVALLPQAPDGKEQTGQKRASRVLWHIQAPHLQYWGDQGRALLDGGVRAESQQGSLLSQTLELFLTPASANGQPATSANQGAGQQRQLTRGLATGGVVVRQRDRQGTAEQAEYFAAEGKFILSGGQPTITDASRDTTTGRQLTFFTASDTILVDSQEGSRTLTKHRVEK